MSGVDRGRNASRGWRLKYIDELEQEYKVPLKWKDGPVPNEDRRVTDKFCCLIFVVFMIFLGVTTVWAFKNSDKDDIYKIYDSEGNACGRDKLRDYPYLYIQNFEEPFKSVCIKECPNFDYNAIKYNVPYDKQTNAVDVNPNYPGSLNYVEFSQ